MKITLGLSILLAGASVFLFSVSEAAAQARRVTSPGAGAVASGQPAGGKENVVIRKIEWPIVKIRTPEFKNDAPYNEQQTQPRDWARIEVQYDTNAEWTDELEFRYSVLLKNSKTSAFIMFPATVTYIDIPKGKRHASTMFLSPTTLDRYGSVEWVGVKIYIRGEQVDMAQVPENDKRPWTAAVKTREGVLLNRAQSPFALLAIDNYETIKPK